MAHPRPTFASTASERPTRGAWGGVVLAAHGAAMALALHGGGHTDTRLLPPSTAQTVSLYYVKPLAADEAPGPRTRMSGHGGLTAGAALHVSSSARLPQPPVRIALASVSVPSASTWSALPAPAAGHSEAPAGPAASAAPAAPTPATESNAERSSTAPRALADNTMPTYPEAAREDALQGSVQLKVEIDTTGRVTAVHWLRRSGVTLLDIAARDAVRAWRFEPARLGADAVPGNLSLTIRFQLDAPVSASALAQAQAAR